MPFNRWLSLPDMLLLWCTSFQCCIYSSICSSINSWLWQKVSLTHSSDISHQVCLWLFWNSNGSSPVLFVLFCVFCLYSVFVYIFLCIFCSVLFTVFVVLLFCLLCSASCIVFCFVFYILLYFVYFVVLYI